VCALVNNQQTLNKIKKIVTMFGFDLTTLKGNKHHSKQHPDGSVTPNTHLLVKS
jgi:hypothetical protein